jgi:type III secretion protein J
MIFTRKSFRRCSLWMSMLSILFSCGRIEVLHDLDETEANRLLRIFYEKNLDVEKQRQANGSWTLSVVPQDELVALEQLQSQRLFQRPKRVLEKSDRIASSREEQRFRYERSLSAALEDTLETLDGVLEARVHLYLPPRDPVFGKLLENNFPASGSVLIVQDHHFSSSAGDLALLVAAAAGLKGENIAVMLQNTSLSSEAPIVAEQKDSERSSQRILKRIFRKELRKEKQDVFSDSLHLLPVTQKESSAQQQCVSEGER